MVFVDISVYVSALSVSTGERHVCSSRWQVCAVHLWECQGTSHHQGDEDLLSTIQPAGLWACEFTIYSYYLQFTIDLSLPKLMPKAWPVASCRVLRQRTKTAAASPVSWAQSQLSADYLCVGSAAVDAWMVLCSRQGAQRLRGPQRENAHWIQRL